MSRTNVGLRLSFVIKCLIVISLSMHEDISIDIKNLTMDWKTIKAFGIRLVTFWGTGYFRGGGGGGGVVTFEGSLFSGFISSHKVLTLLSGGRYFRRVVTIGTLR